MLILILIAINRLARDLPTTIRIAKKKRVLLKMMMMNMNPQKIQRIVLVMVK